MAFIIDVKECCEENKRLLRLLQAEMIGSSRYPAGDPRKFSRKTLGIYKRLLPIMRGQAKTMEMIVAVIEGAKLFEG